MPKVKPIDPKTIDWRRERREARNRPESWWSRVNPTAVVIAALACVTIIALALILTRSKYSESEARSLFRLGLVTAYASYDSNIQSVAKDGSKVGLLGAMMLSRSMAAQITKDLDPSEGAIALCVDEVRNMTTITKEASARLKENPREFIQSVLRD